MTPTDSPTLQRLTRAERWTLRIAFMVAVACLLILVICGAWLSALRDTRIADIGAAQAAGRILGLMAGVGLMLQFTFSARLKMLDRAFGLDRLLRYHKFVAILIGVLASLHPLLVFSGGHTMGGSWPELLGVSLLVLLWVILCTSLWAGFLRLTYRTWWGVHQLVFVAVALVIAHGLTIGGDLASGPLRVIWLALAGAYVCLFIRVKLIKPVQLRADPFKVADVERLNHNVCRVRLVAPAGRSFGHLPGQFAFLKLHGEGLPAAEHPFTISSAPAPKSRRIEFTIKGSGHFTKRIGEFAVGDWATVDGPYGLFSHLVRARRNEPLLMIAGGIGITPILSMLRHMAAAGDERPVTLIWGNRQEEDIVYRDELDALAAGEMNLRIHHVLSEQEDWAGEKGLLDAEMLGRLLSPDDLRSRVFLCGPPPMMTSIRRSLKELGFPRRRVHFERFEL